MVMRSTASTPQLPAQCRLLAGEGCHLNWSFGRGTCLQEFLSLREILAPLTHLALTNMPSGRLHFTRAPIDIKVSSIRRAAPAPGKNTASVDPFLYNPRRASTEKVRNS